MLTRHHVWREVFLRAGWIGVVLGVSSVLAAPSIDLAKHELVGPVKTVITKHPQLRTIHHFDRNGRLLEVELQPLDESDSLRYVFHHDTSGRLIEEHTVRPDGQISHKKLYRYQIDAHGRETAIVAATEDGTLAHADFSLYDSRGHLVEELEISGSGIAEKSLYDVQSNLIYEARYFQGRVVLEATHRYSPLGHLRESRYYAGDGNLMRTDHYRYNETGHRIEQQSEFFRNTYLRKSVVSYETDEAGNWTKETIQRWTEKNGAQSLSETTVSRARQITYYCRQEEGARSC
jgi:hypothetical protein